MRTAPLTRYWITFDWPPVASDGVLIGVWPHQIGFGVTAVDLGDAMGIVRREWFELHDLDEPPVRDVVENVDVSKLDDHVRPNMAPPNWRGMWFARTRPIR